MSERKVGVDVREGVHCVCECVRKVWAECVKRHKCVGVYVSVWVSV